MRRPADESPESGARARARRGRLRWGTRALALAVSIGVLVPAGAVGWAVLVPSASPFVALSSLLATWALPAATWVGLGVASIVLLRRRWFCRWVCPTGLCADGATRVGLRFRRRCPRVPAVGQWAAVVTLGGAAVGYPLLLWLDPLAVLAGAFGLAQVNVAAPFLWSALLLGLVLTASVLWPGIWCARLCPLGGLQELLARIGELSKTLSASPHRLRRQPQPAGSSGVGRRAFLGGIVGLVWASGTRWVRGGAPRAVRPPGAVEEARFTGLCIRCGNCARACPSHVVRPDPGRHGVAGLLAPEVVFPRDYCREDCVRCTEVCPSGALLPVLLEDKPRVRLGLPRVDMDLCLLGEDRECFVCRSRCPYEAIRLVFSEEEYTLVPVVDPDLCPGCGACEAACPTRPERAIVVVGSGAAPRR